MKCFRCSQEITELAVDDPAQDSSQYAYAPAFVIEVLPGGPGGAPGPCRATVLCWTCMLASHVDMWLSEESWDAGTPAVTFQHLPTYDHDALCADEPRTYAYVMVPCMSSEAQR